MKLKLNLKTIVMGISGAIVLLIAILMIILSVASRKPVAAFYGISERNQEKIVEVLQTTHVRKNRKSLPFEIITLDNSISLERALRKSKKPDLLFIYNGLNQEYASNLAAKRKTGLPQSTINGMTSSIRAITPSNNNQINAVPLLIDNYEVDVNVSKFHSSNIKEINVFGDMEALSKMTKSSTPAPIVFAGAEDDELINIFGAITEAVSGKNNWEDGKNKISALIASGKTTYNDFYRVLEELSEEGGAYNKSVSTFRNWSKMEILPKNIYDTKSKDVKAYMSAELTTSAFITLSAHREIERNVITKYSSVYYPSTTLNVERNFTAPVIFAVPLSKDPVVHKSITMLSDELQTLLSAKTGLAPTQANCGTPDVQADDVRYWVAASGTPLPALSSALFVNKQQMHSFAESLRNILH